MRYKKKKYAILSENEELELTPNGDFVIKNDLVENYEIIDFHCHSYEGLFQLFPLFLQKKRINYNKSLMDLSCFPFSINLFDLNKVYFSDCPTKLFSLNGLKTKIKLFTGAFVLNYAATEKLLMDMNNNGISKAVIKGLIVILYYLLVIYLRGRTHVLFSTGIFITVWEHGKKAEDFLTIGMLSAL